MASSKSTPLSVREANESGFAIKLLRISSLCSPRKAASKLCPVSASEKWIGNAGTTSVPKTGSETTSIAPDARSSGRFPTSSMLRIGPLGTLCFWSISNAWSLERLDDHNSTSGLTKSRSASRVKRSCHRCRGSSKSALSIALHRSFQWLSAAAAINM